MPEISIVIVCMGDPRRVLYACLDSIEARTCVSHEIWVVAYRMSAEDRKELSARYPFLRVVESTGVRGFSENNNLVLRQVRGKYVFIVNDDTLMQMPVIDLLRADFDRLPEHAAAIQPRIVFADGRVQTCGRAPWTLLRYMKHYLHGVDETKPGPWSMQTGLFRTYTLNGACFMIRSDVFRQVGWFDERFFFTPEDIALGHALNAAGYTVWADADVSITHLAGSTASSMEAAVKPARVKGALLFYGEGKWWKTKLLALFIFCVEAFRWMKHGGKCASADHILRSVFDHASAKETFMRFHS